MCRQGDMYPLSGRGAGKHWVLPLDMVDNSNSAWLLGIPHFRGRGTPTGEAQAKRALQPTISRVAPRITAYPRPIGVLLTGQGAGRPGQVALRGV
jgi:hypothetical protein